MLIITHWIFHTFPVVTSGHPDPLVSASPVKSASRPLGSQSSHSGNVSLSPFPSLKSISVCPLLLLSYRRMSVDNGQLQHPPLSMRPASLWPASLTLMESDEQRWERLTSYGSNLVPVRSARWEINDNDTGSNLILCSGWQSIVPIFSPLFNCFQGGLVGNRLKISMY